MNTMKYLITITLLIGHYALFSASSTPDKPQVIVMTDGEIDDRSSMVRFLMYTCDMNVRAIIETNSIYQKNGHSDKDWYDNQLDAYEAVYPNLKIHNPDYPSPEYLKSVSFVGDEDFKHLEGLHVGILRPGDPVVYKPDNWADTPGSDRIVEVLLEDNSEQVYIQAWGGGNTAARAFYKLKTEYPKEYERAISRVVMYNIWYQDGAGNYIETFHPKVKMIFSEAFTQSWMYRAQNETFDFVEEHIKNNHGPLGALYPQDYISEGDTPAFLYTLANGLRNYEDPGYGGWGGRFEKLEGFESVYMDALENGDYALSMKRWVDVANTDFQNRMDWCTTSDFKEANHPPVPVIEKIDIDAKSREYVRIDGNSSYDPDGTYASRRWFVYPEAGSYKGPVRLIHSRSGLVSFRAPQVEKPETIHVILQLEDYEGDFLLKSFQRVIVTVKP